MLEPVRSRWQWRDHTVQLLRAPHDTSPVRIVVVHGAGAHSEALWPLAALLAGRDYDITAVDLPLYGDTYSPDPGAVRYTDWVELLRDFAAAHADERPLILVGASIGGLLAVDVASGSPHVATVIATCLLDPGDWRARAAMNRFGHVGAAMSPLLTLARGRMLRMRVPMRWVAKLSRMSHNADLSALCARDPKGGGARVSLGFLASYLNYRHTSLDTCTVPVFLAHPAEDNWTPPSLSMRALARIPARTTTLMLHGCGHFPIEEPGVGQLLALVDDIAKNLTLGSRNPRQS